MRGFNNVILLGKILSIEKHNLTDTVRLIVTIGNEIKKYNKDTKTKILVMHKFRISVLGKRSDYILKNCSVGNDLLIHGTLSEYNDHININARTVLKIEDVFNGVGDENEDND